MEAAEAPVSVCCSYPDVSWSSSIIYAQCCAWIYANATLELNARVAWNFVAVGILVGYRPLYYTSRALFSWV